MKLSTIFEWSYVIINLYMYRDDSQHTRFSNIAEARQHNICMKS